MRRAATVGAVVAVAVVAALAVADALREETGGQRSTPTVAQPTGLQVSSIVSVARPAGVGVATGLVWVASTTEGAVLAVDPAAREIVKTVEIDVDATSLAATEDAVLAIAGRTDEAVVIRPGDGRVLRQIPLPGAELGVGVADGDLWVADPGGDRVLRIEPDGGRVVAQIAVPTPTAVAASPDAVWAASASGRSVARIDPASNLVLAILPLDAAPEQVVATRDAVWVSHPATSAITRIDARRSVVDARVELGAGREPLFAAAAPDGLWVLAIDRLLHIDAATGAVDVEVVVPHTRPPGPEPLVAGGLAVVGGTAWVADTYGSRLLAVGVG